MAITLQPHTRSIKKDGANVARSYAPEGDFRSQIRKEAIQAHPTSNETLNTPVIVQFGFPLPPNECVSENDIKVQDTQGNDLKCHVKSILRYHSWTDDPLVYERAFRISFETTFTDLNPVDFVVVYGKGASTQALTDPGDKYNWVSYRDGEQWANFNNVTGTKPAADYDGTPFGMSLEDITEPRTWVTLTPQYMKECELYNAFTDGVSNSTSADLANCFDFLSNAAKTITNEVGSHVAVNFLTPYMVDNGSIGTSVEPASYATWLFDRATAIYLNYLITGDVKWLKQGHRATQYYSKKLVNGNFSMTGRTDLKYSYGKCLLIDAQLTGDISVANPINDFKPLLDSYDHDYQYIVNSTKLWTERHTAYKLAGYISMWELTGNSDHRTQIKDIFNVLYRMQQTPENGQTKSGSFRHTLNSHESDFGDTFIGSPWMTALLIPHLIQYRDLSKDARTLTVLSDLGDWIENHCTREFNFGVNNEATTCPYYFGDIGFGSSNGNNGTDDPFTDIVHAFDVSSVVLAGAWAKKRLNINNDGNLLMWGKLIRAAKLKFDDLYRSQPETIAGGGTVYRAAPTRSYNWWAIHLDMVGLRSRC